jgi:hypothetical protein
MNLNELFFFLSNVLLTLCGVPAVLLSQTLEYRTQRLAPIFGLLGQPAWFYVAWYTNSLGVVVLCVLYTISWALGLYNFWVAVPRGLPGINLLILLQRLLRRSAS